MDARAAKLALARQKLKNHQEKKQHENISNEQSKHSSPVPDAKHHQNEFVPDVCLVPVAASQSEHHNTLSEDNIIEPAPINKHDINLNATQILISNERTLETQINNLQAKLTELEYNLMTTTQNYDWSRQRIINLENDLKMSDDKYKAAVEQAVSNDAVIKDLNDMKANLIEQNSHLQEQLEFTKSMLTSKEAENDSLHSQLYTVQKQLDVSLLQLQQLTNGVHPQHSDEKMITRQDNEILTQKISTLEQQLKSQVKDYQQLNNHYENYVGELNNQLLLLTKKNDDLTKQVQSLSNREASLIEQIGDMEIRIQNFNKYANVTESTAIDTSELDEIKEKYEKALQNLQGLSVKYEELQKLYTECKAELEILSQSKEIETQDSSSENVSLLKLNADITSDKIAAQRATEQNKKLKQDIQGLEDVVVKMTKDKLELTEKITAEKYLNRELTIKLAEIDEKASDMQKTIRAKDEEMIRLQTSCRVLEQKYNEIAENLKHLNGNSDDHHDDHNLLNHDHEEHGVDNVDDTIMHMGTDCHHHESKEHTQDNMSIPKTDAMIKLQERFLKIMNEVADLSDEKHRLEHIITQLQNETDTICEYVALYQQQRCLLKKRDEDRTAQMKMFQSECTRLQNQLNELTGILKNFAEDKDLSSYFQVQTKHEEIQKVMNLLSKLKTNSLVDPEKSVKFNDFYHSSPSCSCCSGQLIEV